MGAKPSFSSYSFVRKGGGGWGVLCLDEIGNSLMDGIDEALKRNTFFSINGLWHKRLSYQNTMLRFGTFICPILSRSIATKKRNYEWGVGRGGEDNPILRTIMRITGNSTQGILRQNAQVEQSFLWQGCRYIYPYIIEGGINASSQPPQYFCVRPPKMWKMWKESDKGGK